MQSCCMKHHQGEIVMTIYTIVLFFHVSGAIGYFVSMGTWLFGLSALRRAQRVEQVRALTHLVGWSGPLFAISVLLILATGLYMALTAWGLQTGWIDVALISLILIAPLGTAFIDSLIVMAVPLVLGLAPDVHVSLTTHTTGQGMATQANSMREPRG